jgi:hypothetical protein
MFLVFVIVVIELEVFRRQRNRVCALNSFSTSLARRQSQCHVLSTLPYR